MEGATAAEAAADKNGLTKARADSLAVQWKLSDVHSIGNRSAMMIYFRYRLFLSTRQLHFLVMLYG
jgi:hypothetical protein